MLIQTEKLSRQKLLQQHLIILQHNYLGDNFQCILYIEIYGFLSNYICAKIFPVTKNSTKYQPYWPWFPVARFKSLLLGFTGPLSNFSWEMFTEIYSLKTIMFVPAVLFNHYFTMKTSNNLMYRSPLQIFLSLFQDYSACTTASQNNKNINVLLN